MYDFSSNILELLSNSYLPLHAIYHSTLNTGIDTHVDTHVDNYVDTYIDVYCDTYVDNYVDARHPSLVYPRLIHAEYYEI
jgi:hypothetical protein